VALLAEERNACRVLVGKPEGTKILARCRRRIKIDCRAMGWDNAAELISFRIAKCVRFLCTRLRALKFHKKSRVS
jgi:hypothetical protein